MEQQIPIRPSSIERDSCAPLSAPRSDYPAYTSAHAERSRTATVLLVDNDQKHAECVCASLSFHHLEVDVYLNPEQAALHLRRAGNDYDVVILNVSNYLLPWVNLLAKLQGACLESGGYLSPLFLCTSTRKQPPEFELRIERMGARYVCEE